MANQPFKFRHVNKFSGAFIFVSLAIIVAFIALAGRAQQWFVRTSEYRVVLVLPEKQNPPKKATADDEAAEGGEKSEEE